jgi:predicted permease
MDMTTLNKPRAAFWIIAVITLIWNIMGVMAYLEQAYMTNEDRALLPEAEQALYSDIPAWFTAAFAFAVFGGLLGALALLLRKKWATSLFILSLLGIIIQMIYHFFISNAMDVYGPRGLIMPSMVLIIGFFLVWYSKKVTAHGWLN